MFFLPLLFFVSFSFSFSLGILCLWFLLLFLFTLNCWYDGRCRCKLCCETLIWHYTFWLLGNIWLTCAFLLFTITRFMVSNLRRTDPKRIRFCGFFFFHFNLSSSLLKNFNYDFFYLSLSIFCHLINLFSLCFWLARASLMPLFAGIELQK